MLTVREHFCWGVITNGVFVMVHDGDVPGNRDWDECMGDLERFSRGQRPTAMVFTDGGAPSRPQRAALNRLVGKSPPTAVVSDALVTRFVVSSFALVNSSIASFASSEFDHAWSHLGLTGGAAIEARDELAREAKTLPASFKSIKRAFKL